MGIYKKNLEATRFHEIFGDISRVELQLGLFHNIWKVLQMIFVAFCFRRWLQHTPTINIVVWEIRWQLRIEDAEAWFNF